MNISFSDFVVPVIFAFVLIYGVIKKVDVFDSLLRGIEDGARTVIGIFPSLFALVLAVGMFKSSGGLQLIASWLKPLTDLLGFPSETMPLLLMRPFSGSGSIALFESVLQQTGADSYAGRVASVILGSSETTFYTIAVYFAATKVKKTRHALPSALSGDLITAVMATIVVSLWFYA